MSDAAPVAPREHVDRLRADAPWLFARELCTCVVGSAALLEACRREAVPGPRTEDLDHAWAPDGEAGGRILADHGVLVPTTEGSRARGTLALRAGRQRIEITSFRGAGDTPLERIHADLARRDMTIGAVAWWLAEDRILDPFHGVEHWRERRIEPVGDPLERAAEHPIRWIRWYRRAHELGFRIGSAIRRLGFDDAWCAAMPAEAIAQELRRALDRLESPGRLLVELHEAGGLARLAPELAPQFDGRPAGPLRHHPEISQALHMVLALEWAAAHTRDLGAADRNAVLVAVLCHDLGKGTTPPELFPSHPGHEDGGVPLVRNLLDRLPGLTDPRGRRLAEQVCRLHLKVRHLREMRAGTLASLYERDLRGPDFPVELLALAVGADVGGRLDRAVEGESARVEVAAELALLRRAAESVDAVAIRARFAGDLDGFRAELHALRARAIAAALRRQG